MTRFFMHDSELNELEQLIMLVPNFSPRRSGIVVLRGFVNDNEQDRVHMALPYLINRLGSGGPISGAEGSYENFISNCFQECKLYRFRSRLEYLIRNCTGDFFISQTHRARFDSVCRLSILKLI